MYAFKFRQCLFCILTNCRTYDSKPFQCIIESFPYVKRFETSDRKLLFIYYLHWNEKVHFHVSSSYLNKIIFILFEKQSTFVRPFTLTSKRKLPSNKYIFYIFMSLHTFTHQFCWSQIKDVLKNKKCIWLILMHTDIKFPLPIFCKRFPFNNLCTCRVFSALKKPWQFLTVTIDGGWLSLFAKVNPVRHAQGRKGGIKSAPNLSEKFLNYFDHNPGAYLGF